MQIRRLLLALKAFNELGPRQMGLYALYQLGLRSSYFRFRPSAARLPGAGGELQTGWLETPTQAALAACLGAEGQARLLAEADEVVAGNVRLFGGTEPVPLALQPATPLRHWTVYERNGHGEDIKLTWEPGRFGWAYTLGRAYRLSGDESYPGAFWRYSETFLEANPPYLGPHWCSAQEAALRLIGLVWSAQVFAGSEHSTSARLARLAQAVAQHARRIPPTLVYARAQNNNHLLSEAAGLYTAGLALPEDRHAKSWREMGWRWFERGLLAQIAEDGAYSQHSANYQRLMLQLALWMQRLAQCQGHGQGGDAQEFSVSVQARLRAATRWLLALLDPASGSVPNLGPNDGAYILPLSACPFSDYRPVLQAASAVFLGERSCGEGAWDEMGLWLGRNAPAIPPSPPAPPPRGEGSHTESPLTLRSADGDNWAYLRAARFTGRPGHADQLHLDLWWRGLNIAQDAGTYRYNAPAPWDNALTHSAVHNTLTINGQEQMQRAGRFLYLDWAQAQGLVQEAGAITAQNDGYRRFGLLHQRCVRLEEGRNASGGWLVEDALLPLGTGPAQAVEVSVQWLLPDGQYAVIEPTTIEFVTQNGPLRLELAAGEAIHSPLRLQIVRAGQVVYGEGRAEPAWGWSSPTYGLKIPALSVRASLTVEPILFAHGIPAGKATVLWSRFLWGPA